MTPTHAAATANTGNTSIAPCLRALGIADHPRFAPPDGVCTGTHAISINPATGRPIGGVRFDDVAQYDRAAAHALAAFRSWRTVPAPVRGEIVRRIGNAFRDHKDDLGALVTLEAGKITAEGLGEVQECIDIADFAVGLSRQLHGLSIASERPSHRLLEQWHPLGVVGVITAFNFPVAVWAWNAMLAMVCGDAVLWKPSSRTPLTALAMTAIAHRVLREQDLWRPEGINPTDLLPLIVGRDADVGEAMTADRRLPLISATGSCRMGRHVAQKVAARLGRTLLELGGNNALILMPDADMDMALRAIVFGAVGTAGQRCTSTRRLLCVGDAAERILPRLIAAYRTIRIGDPAEPGVLMGPLIAPQSVDAMRRAIERALAEGCTVVGGVGGIEGIERQKARTLGAGNFVEPTIIRVPKGTTPAITREETFAPILYVFEFDTLEEAIADQNDVDQGLSSAIFTDSFRAAERFLGPEGSDCGIANVNAGTSGAEIGGAFGGEKDTGGGRESGSDSWKQYMRRQTCTLNHGTNLPLAQGIRFE
jgi:aldehyde dehydrogenase (NAD+)